MTFSESHARSGQRWLELLGPEITRLLQDPEIVPSHLIIGGCNATLRLGRNRVARPSFPISVHNRVPGRDVPAGWDSPGRGEGERISGTGRKQSNSRGCVCCRKRFSRAGPSLWWTCTSIIRSRARTSARSTSASSTTSKTAHSSCASYRSVDVPRALCARQALCKLTRRWFASTSREFPHDRSRTIGISLRSRGEIAIIIARQHQTIASALALNVTICIITHKSYRKRYHRSGNEWVVTVR